MSGNGDKPSPLNNVNRAKNYSKFLPAWTFEYLTIQLGPTSAQCLVCKRLVVCKKFNIKRHYDFCHGTQYDNIVMEARQQLVEDLTKELNNSSNNTENEPAGPSEERKSKKDYEETAGSSQRELSPLTQAIEALQKISERGSVLSEFETFGQLVTTQLEQLPLDDALQLETEIIGLINAKRIKLFKGEGNDPSLVGDEKTDVLVPQM